jgi:AcrR family transcriptional regulator
MTAPSRAQATRARLLEAGRRAFAAKGVDGTKLREDILQPAGISVGSFYHQFGDKTELLFAILREETERFRVRLSQAHAPGPGRTLLDICRESYGTTLDLAERQEEFLRIQLRERNATDPRVREFLREERRRWMESIAQDYERIAAAGSLRIDAALAAELTGALSLGILTSYLELPRARRRRERARVLEAMCRFTVGGLGAAVASKGAPPRASPRKGTSR